MKLHTLFIFIGLIGLLASCGESKNQAWKLADQSTEAMKKEDWRSADTLLAQAVEIAPNFAEAYMVRGRVLEQLGRNDDALECYHQALICYDKRIEEHSRDLQRYVDRAFLKTIVYDSAGMENDLKLAIEHGLDPAAADVFRRNATQEVEKWRAGAPVLSPNELAGR